MRKSTSKSKVKVHRYFDDLTSFFCGNEEQALCLLKSGIDVNAKGINIDNKTLLMGAAKNGHKRVVDALLSKNASVNSVDDCGNTALMFACLGGYSGCVQSILFSWSADIDSKNISGNTALILTASLLKNTGHLDCLRLLLAQDADLDIRNNYGMTALMYCASNSQAIGFTALKELLKAGANTNFLSGEGESLLMLASRNSYVEILNYLLTDTTGFDIHLKNRYGDNALIMALKSSEKSSSKRVEILLEAGSDPNSISGDGTSAMNIAAAMSFEKSRQLLCHGAVQSLSTMYLNENNHNYETGCGSIFSPFDVAVFNKQFTTANFLLSFVGFYPYSLFGSHWAKYLDSISEENHLNKLKVVNEMIKKTMKCTWWVEKARNLINRPQSLMLLCSRVVSQMAGSSPGRRDRLVTTGLPPSLVRLVMVDVEEQYFVIQ